LFFFEEFEKLELTHNQRQTVLLGSSMHVFFIFSLLFLRRGKKKGKKTKKRRGKKLAQRTTGRTRD
jgi:hypothetical protein